MKMAKYLQISAMALFIPVLASCAGTNNLLHETRTQARTLQEICTEAFNKKGDNFYIRRFIGGECVESYHFGGIEILIYQPSPDNPFEGVLTIVPKDPKDEIQEVKVKVEVDLTIEGMVYTFLDELPLNRDPNKRRESLDKYERLLAN